MTASKIQAYFRQLNLEQNKYMSNVFEFFRKLPQIMEPKVDDYIITITYSTEGRGLLAEYNNTQTGLPEGTLSVMVDVNTQAVIVNGNDIDEDELNTVLFAPIVDRLCDTLDPTNISYEIDLAELSICRSVDEPLKLFVWEGVLCDHTAGVIFALARDPDEARRAVIRDASQHVYGGCHWLREGMVEDPTIHDDVTGYFLYGGS